MRPNNLSGRIAQVLYKFDASYADELSCQIGDVLQIVYKIDDQWVYARSLMPLDCRSIQSGGGSGQFPLNHLNLLDIDEHVFSRQNIYIALSNFRFEADGDLDFQKGELLVCLKQIDANWLSGHYLSDSKRKGIFPVTHVAKLSLAAADDETTSRSSRREQEATTTTRTTMTYKMPLPAKAISVFRSEEMSAADSNLNYLNVDFGDYLLITARLDANWYSGENHLGKKGVFPVSCVQLLSNEKNGSGDGNKMNDDMSMMPLLNRTQRRYTIDSVSTDVVEEPIRPSTPQQQLEYSDISDTQHEQLTFDINNQHQHQYYDSSSFHNNYNTSILVNDMSIEEDKSSINRHDEEKVTTCVVNFDFVAETSDDLGCRSGEMLKVESQVNNEWLRCSNQLGRTGIVPAAFVTVLGRDDWSVVLSEPVAAAAANELATHEEKYRPVRPPPPPPSPQKQPPPQAQRQPLNRLISQSSSSLSPTTTTTIPPPPLLPPPPPPALPPPLMSSSSKRLNNATASLSNLSLSNDAGSCSPYRPRKPPMPPKQKMSKNDNNNDLNAINRRQIDEKQRQSMALDDSVVAENAKREKNRLLTIKELIQTESDYLVELSICYDAFMNDDRLCELSSPPPPSSEFNREALFGKLKPIIEASKCLVEAFDAELKSSDNNPLKMHISSCLIRVASQMQYPYADYARAHNDVNILVKKYEENPTIQEYINTRLGEIKDNIKSIPHLASILIKPVQRIAKYPLFLTQLIKVTDKTDPDFNGLNEALTTYTEMLEFINEFKRRKDLVDKYLSKYNNDVSIMDIMKKINMKSLRKKSNRLSMQLSNKLGLSNPHVLDENFLRVEEEFRFVERSVKNFATDLNSYLANFKEVLDYEKNMFTDMLFIFDDEFQLYSKFESGANARRSIDFLHYSNQVINQVLNPLNALINCFNGPNTLINKRTHKLLDYEGALADFELKSSQSGSAANALPREVTIHLDRTRKDYEALNCQLIEEMPLLTQKAVKLFTLCVKNFVTITDKFLRLVVTSIRHIMDETQFEQVCSQQAFDENRRVSQLIRVRTINEKFEQSGTTTIQQHHPERPTTSINLQLPTTNDHMASRQQRATSMIPTFEYHNNNNNNSSKSRPNSDSSSSSSIGLPVSPVRPQSTATLVLSDQPAPIQSEEQRRKLIEKYPIDEIYVVTQKYIANEKLCQLKSNINELVAMIKPYDPAQQTHIWFVDNGSQRGFIPANALTPYSQLYNTNNLINLEDDTTASNSGGGSKRNSHNTKSSSSSTSGLDEAAACALVDILDDMTPPSYPPPPPPTPLFCVAMYDLKAPASNTIDLVKNQKYRVLEKCDKRGDSEWWLVESTANGLRGYVPKSYIKIV